MSKKLKMGAVGIGGIWSGIHADAWLKHPEVEIVAVCDIVESKARKFAEAHKIPHVTTDYRELLKLEEIDFIDICTPNLLHSEISVAALNVGKHVICEKPDAVSPQEAQKMADAARRAGKVMMVMRNNRFASTVQFLRKFIDGGHMGEVYTGRCGWIRRRGIPGKGGWFTTKALSGGGPLIDLGVHYLDLAIWLMGNPRPAGVVGQTYRKFADSGISDSEHAKFGEARSGGAFDVEDLASGFIRFQNGASLQLEFSWASNIEEEDSFLELRGTRSGLNMRHGGSDLKIFTEIAGTLCDVHPRIQRLPGDHARNLYHFVDCVRGRAEPIIRPEDGVDMIRILAAVYESANSGSEVKL